MNCGCTFDVLCLGLLLFVVLPYCGATEDFIAAVYEHEFVLPSSGRDVIVSRDAAIDYMMKNMDVYKKQIKEAQQQGASIIVFPEYGLTGIGFSTRESFAPYLEDIPDPHQITCNPCSDPSYNKSSPVLCRLSCLAKQHQLYLVANMGDKKPCDRKDPDCPPNGQYQYNTNVVFNPQGSLVARYHKQHPFMEERERIDIPKTSKYITFNTPFGKFGTFICFDVLFKEPAVTLVEKYYVDHIVFTTAWFDKLPLFSAIGFHSSWARLMGVNYLSANTHIPLLGSTGSALYTPSGARMYYRDTGLLSKGKLLISTLSKNPKRSRIIYNIIDILTSIHQPEISNLPESSSEFYSELFGDPFLFRSLESTSGSVSVCYNGTSSCCSLTYSMYNHHPGKRYALGVFRGLHRKEGQYYLEICVLLKCATLDQHSCGKETYSAGTIFDNIALTAQTETPYVYPQLVTDGVNLAPSEWQHLHKTILVKRPLSAGLLTAALFGRNYDLDPHFL